MSAASNKDQLIEDIIQLGSSTGLIFGAYLSITSHLVVGEVVIKQ
jgi:hypothetical protein